MISNLTRFLMGTIRVISSCWNMTSWQCRLSKDTKKCEQSFSIDETVYTVKSNWTFHAFKSQTKCTTIKWQIFKKLRLTQEVFLVKYSFKNITSVACCLKLAALFENEWLLDSLFVAFGDKWPVMSRHSNSHQECVTNQHLFISVSVSFKQMYTHSVCLLSSR